MKVMRRCGYCERLIIADDDAFIKCHLIAERIEDSYLDGISYSVCGSITCSEDCAANHAGKEHDAPAGSTVDIR